MSEQILDSQVKDNEYIIRITRDLRDPQVEPACISLHTEAANMIDSLCGTIRRHEARISIRDEENTTLLKERDAYKMLYEDSVNSYKYQGEGFSRAMRMLERLKEILTPEVLMELGSEKHEILIPDLVDEVKRILNHA